MMQLPLFPPESRWLPPARLPEIADTVIALDLECKDPNLVRSGPGWHRRDGEPVGVALAGGTWQMYLPFGHFDGGNLPRNIVVDYTKEILKRCEILIMHNAQYDLGWLRFMGIVVPSGCTIVDTMVVEALLDEEHPDGYSLSACSKRRLGVSGKREELLRRAADEYGVDPKSGMWKLASRYVGPYAEADARTTYDLYNAQQPLIGRDNLGEVFALECRVTPALAAMAARGIEVDLDAAQRLNDEWIGIENTLLRELGLARRDIWTNDFLTRLCREEGIEMPRTKPTKSFPEGQPSFSKDFIRGHSHPLINKLAQLRELSRLRQTYVEDNILKGHINGRVYPNYRQLAADDGGTRTGRLSACDHNIQQIPKRSSLVDAKRIRHLYVSGPDRLWAKCDYSSQEPRLQVHYGLLCGYDGAEMAADYFARGKKLYHLIQEMAGCSYDDSKMVYLALSYGMGDRSLGQSLGLSAEQARSQVLAPLILRCPFMVQFAEAASAKAQKRGYVRTLMGRRRRFPLWQSRNHWDYLREMDNTPYGTERHLWLKTAVTPADLDRARAFFGPGEPLQRAYTGKAGNAIIQGSAGDQTKLALALLYEEGFDIVSQVHDEINSVVPDEATATRMKEIMEHAVELKLPVLADLELGEHWR